MGSSSSKFSKGVARTQTIVIEPPASLKSEVVRSRLQKQAEALRHQSFDHYKRAYDMTTGQKKNSSDPRLLDQEECQYVKKLQGLVGKPYSKAPRMLRQNAYTLNKGRSKIANRKEQTLRKGDEVTEAILNGMSEVGTTSLLKGLVG